MQLAGRRPNIISAASTRNRSVGCTKNTDARDKARSPEVYRHPVRKEMHHDSTSPHGGSFTLQVKWALSIRLVNAQDQRHCAEPSIATGANELWPEVGDGLTG